MKEFSDDNFKFDKNSIKFSKWVENTVGRGEITQRAISPFPTVFFKRLVLQPRKNDGILWQRDNCPKKRSLFFLDWSHIKCTRNVQI